MKKIENRPWHALPAPEVASALEVDPDAGLSPDEAARRLEQFGPNRLPEPERKSALRRLLEQFHNVLIYVLIAAAIFTAILGEWIDFAVILAVVIINAVIGFVQEGKAEQALEGIRRMLSLEANAVREGHRRTIPAEELVPGDVVMLESGDRVPADIRVLEARNARVEEAALTGESQPVDKSPTPVDEEAVLGDRRSLAFSGTMLTSGRLRGVVIATGERTEIGRIGEMVASVEEMSTPLLRKIDKFARQLSIAIVVTAALLFAFGWFFRGYAFEDLFLIAVSFAVAAIPEGLPAILTITLALGVTRMARRNSIIRRLPAVETLGSVTVICSDKTGTLTRNEMTAGRVLTADRLYTVGGSGYEPEGEIQLEGSTVSPADDEVLVELARAGTLSNDSELHREDGDWKLDGDPTEGAMLVLGAKLGLERDAEMEAWERVDVIPFESENAYMATLHERPGGGRVIFLKGAPERVLEMCDTVRNRDGDQPLDAESWRNRVDEIADEGYRMLAVAMRDADSGMVELRMEDVAEGMVLLGVAGLIDPPRPEAIQAVSECRTAGITVKMITGDHALTARSIGAQLGIGDGTKAFTGQQIERTSDEDLVKVVEEFDVFARSSPEHKLRLVRALQARGEITAMTGDGVNDAPALKQADIGVAMGIKGTEAAKSAAEMVLADDNFASIEKAVEEGRTVFDNLRKTILFILPTNGAEALMVIFAVAFAFTELPMTPVQILWVNMVTAVTLALALAFEPQEPGIMERPPRRPDAPIISRYLLFRIAYVSVMVAVACVVLFLRDLSEGVDPARARTVAVNALVTAEVFYLFNARSVMAPALRRGHLFDNRAVWIAVGLLIVFQGIFTYVPLVQGWFGTAALDWFDWVRALGVGVGVFVAVEIEKAIGRARKRKHS